MLPRFIGNCVKYVLKENIKVVSKSYINWEMKNYYRQICSFAFFFWKVYEERGAAGINPMFHDRSNVFFSLLGYDSRKVTNSQENWGIIALTNTQFSS
jgi:hypothetical protein